jgi:hypothetical protein
MIHPDPITAQKIDHIHVLQAVITSCLSQLNMYHDVDPKTEKIALVKAEMLKYQETMDAMMATLNKDDMRFL